MGQYQLPFGNGFLDLQFVEVFFLMSQHKIRHHSDSQTDPGQIQKKIVAGQLCLGSQRKAVADKKLLEKTPVMLTKNRTTAKAANKLTMLLFSLCSSVSID